MSLRACGGPKEKEDQIQSHICEEEVRKVKSGRGDPPLFNTPLSDGGHESRPKKRHLL